MTRCYRLAGRVLEAEFPSEAPEEPGWAAAAAPGGGLLDSREALRVLPGPLPPRPPDARRVLRSPAGDAWEAVGGERVLHFLAAGRRAAVEPGRGRAWVADEPGDRFPLAHPLGEMVATSLLEGLALEIHAGAVARGGEAWALAGVSGAGKSTLSGLWGGLPGWRRLAEERLLAWKGPEGWLVEAAPWPPGVERGRGTARLRGVLLLGRGDRLVLTPASPGRAVAALLQATFFLSGSPRSLEAVGRLASGLAGDLPVLGLSTPATAEAMAEAAHRLAGA